MPNLKQKVAKGAVWTLMEKVSCQAVGFVVGMILARLLTPTEFGTVALTGIFFAVAGFPELIFSLQGNGDKKQFFSHAKILLCVFLGSVYSLHIYFAERYPRNFHRKGFSEQKFSVLPI